ncbi:hypothetical protein MPSEU_000072400 [Mayamaea pseudoterrestris]|nr:hypothetical protein MPSEU_000072400 [Mayamaea pseudoterrestris]
MFNTRPTVRNRRPVNATHHAGAAANQRPLPSAFGRTHPTPTTKPSNMTLQQKLIYMAGTIATFAVFYLTPASEIVTNELLLPMVPLASDYEMGRQALQELPYDNVYRSSWAPMLKTVSNDLIKSFQANNDKHKSYVWDVAIVRSDAINAFALPGGVIRVTDTLLNAIKPTKGELAALVGHEMGHVIHRHSQARVLQSKVVSWIIQAFVYDDKDDDQETFGQALGELLAKSAAWLGQQKFSRRDEYQADAMSWELLMLSGKYGYNPQSLHSLLDKLWKMEKGQSGSKDQVTSTLENWSRTHPATKDRIDALDEKWKALPTNERRQLGRNPV